MTFKAKLFILESACELQTKDFNMVGTTMYRLFKGVCSQEICGGLLNME